MENVRNFFDEMNSKISEDIEYFEHDSEHKYRKLRSIDFQKIRFYRNKIADKLFSINKDDREIYAGLMIQEIDANNFGEDLTQKEERIGERNYKLYSIKNELGKEEFVDVSEIVDDCEFFVVWVFELFLSFHINMIDIVKKFDLLHDYTKALNLTASELRRYTKDKRKDAVTNSDTLYRQVLTIRTLLTKMGVNYQDTNNATLTKFIQFLLNREIDTPVQNSYIYDIVREKKEKLPRNYNEAHDLVAEQFERINLTELAEHVRKGKEMIKNIFER